MKEYEKLLEVYISAIEKILSMLPLKLVKNSSQNLQALE